MKISVDDFKHFGKCASRTVERNGTSKIQDQSWVLLPRDVDAPMTSTRAIDDAGPQKCIATPKDVETFHQSEAFHLIVGFVRDLSDSVLDHKISDECACSPTVVALIDVLQGMKSWTEAYPPIRQPMRFGNRAYRSWFQHFEQILYSVALERGYLVRDVLPAALHSHVAELLPYLLGAFGNAARIDYGTGHELSFLAFLLGLDRLQAIDRGDYPAVVLRGFLKYESSGGHTGLCSRPKPSFSTRYLEVARHLQELYVLEPAGSHGVWGLDDYQFLPFIFGSAQLCNHPTIRPSSVFVRVGREDGSRRLYVFGVHSVHQPAQEGAFCRAFAHAYDIAAVPTWSKVNSGLQKMYVAEVLSKFPVVQHFSFGRLLPFAVKQP